MEGIGKTEPLTGDLQGEYSRRINDKDRLVYHMEDASILHIAEVTTVINRSLTSRPARAGYFLVGGSRPNSIKTQDFLMQSARKDCCSN